MKINSLKGIKELKQSSIFFPTFIMKSFTTSTLTTANGGTQLLAETASLHRNEPKYTMP